MDIVGKMLAGRYEILEEVGKGGMAHVYKARCHFLNRFVAVKVLKEELKDDKEFVHRFNTEAQAAARISNPHVVSIFDVGFENGLYYIVMEYVEGITLKEYISKKRVLSWQEAAEFAAQICEGLDAAHKKSVIHRDIKPQNIILTKGNVLKITDFGIARASTQATTTAANSTIGTVHYLSPEQARGGYTNERTDIYSLGVVLYEMLTGRLPFNDNTPVAIAIKHIQEKPILPRILNTEIPATVEQIVMKAMNKEQSLRYASAEEFLRDLNAVIKNPDIQLGIASGIDDIEATRKHNPIKNEDIENYERNKRKNTSSDFDKYSNKADEETEERRLREINRKRAIREQKKKERKITIAAILAAILVIAGMGAVFSAMSGGGFFGIFSGSEKIEIPSVIDSKLEDAQKKYRAEGFSVIKQGEKTSDKAAGIILEQEPPAGAELAKRDDIVIRVVVSSGNASKKVGNYTDKKIDEAKKMVAEDGFKVNIVEKESSSEEKDTVISQEPAEGTEVSEGALITLYVSLGDEKKDDKKDEDKEDEDKTSEASNNNRPSSESSNESENNRPSNNESNNSESNNDNVGSENEGQTTPAGNTGTESTTTPDPAPSTSNAAPGISN